MNISIYIILALLISIFASSRDVDLFTNTNFLLLLLLAIGAYYFPRRSSTSNSCQNANNQGLLDIIF